MKSIFKTILVISLFIILGYSCDDNPTEDNKSTPGRRDYTWTWDTLDINYLYLTKIWGSSSNDVWAVGDIDYGEGLWHYDGQKWSKYPQPWGMIPSAIYGFASNDVWIACAGPSFWHFDGTSWTKFSEHILPEYNVTRIRDIWGDSHNNIYAVGYKYKEPDTYAVIMHYDGSKWDYISIRDEKVSFSSIRKNNMDNICYIRGYSMRPFETDSSYIYRISKNDIEIKYKSQTSKTLLSVVDIKGKVYLIFENIIYTIESDNLKLFKDFSGTGYVGRMWGRSESDFFGMQSYGIAHYNGVDLSTIVSISRISYVEAIVFDKDVFFILANSYDPLNIILRGTLK